MPTVAGEHLWLLSLGKVNPLDIGDCFADLARAQHIKVLGVRLELGKVLVIPDTFVVFLILEAYDSAASVTNRQDISSLIECHCREQVML